MILTIKVDMKELRRLITSKGTTWNEVGAKITDDLMGAMRRVLRGTANEGAEFDEPLRLEKKETAQNYHGLVFRLNTSEEEK